jgi:putative intracellular protease/amidase
MQLVTVALLVLFAPASGWPWRNITSLKQVGVSGDRYPQVLPAVRDANAFRGKSVLFAIDHGVEDHEVYYQYQYFSDRGAHVSWARPGGGKIVLSDFFNPSHLVESADDLDHIDLSNFDAIFVAGGLPSSAGLRRSSFPRRFAAFVRRGGAEKLAAVICSGNEVLVEAGLLDDFRRMSTSSAPDVLMDGVVTTARPGDIVGSPASVATLSLAVQQIGGRYLASDPKTQYVAYPSQMLEGNQTAVLVLGKNPNASPAFVTAIGSLWMGLQERMPGSYDVDGNFHASSGSADLGTALRVEKLSGLRAAFKNEQASSDGSFFVHRDLPQIRSLPLSTLEGCCNGQVDHYTQEKDLSRSIQGLHVVLAVSSGSEVSSTHHLKAALTDLGARVDFGCPSWYWPGKNGEVYLFSEPPIAPQATVTCDVSFGDVGVCSAVEGCPAGTAPVMPDALIVPSGLFATHGVLRNDGSLPDLIRNMASAGKVLGAVGSGVGVLSASLSSFECKFAVSSANQGLVSDIQLQAGRPILYSTEVGPSGACAKGAAVLTSSSKTLDEFLQRLVGSLAADIAMVV